MLHNRFSKYLKMSLILLPCMVIVARCFSAFLDRFHFVALMPDYDEKAEDAVDYEDIDEQYEGPEIQAASEEDYLLPKKEYFSNELSLAALKPTASVFDDENYDEETEQENEVVENTADAQTIIVSGIVLV